MGLRSGQRDARDRTQPGQEGGTRERGGAFWTDGGRGDAPILFVLIPAGRTSAFAVSPEPGGAAETWVSHSSCWSVNNHRNQCYNRNMIYCVNQRRGNKAGPEDVLKPN